MTRKPSNISILQFDEHLISLLRGTGSARGAEVLDCEVEQGDWSQEDGSFQEALTGFVKAHSVAEDRVYTVIPRHNVTARILELPTQDSDEIGGMVKLSAADFVPYPADEVAVFHTVLRKTETDGAMTLAVVVHKDVLRSHVAMLAEAGIEPEKIYLSTQCLINACGRLWPELDSCYAVADLAGSALEVIVMRGSHCEYSRGIAAEQGWSPEGAGGSALEELENDLRSSLSTHRRESADGMGAQTVFLGSSSSSVDAVARKFSEALGITCEPAGELTGLIARGASHVKFLPLVGAGALVTALEAREDTINLLPEDIRVRRSMASMRTTVLRIGVVGTLAIAAVFATYLQNYYQRTAYISELETRIEAIRPSAQNVLTKRKHLERLRRQVERRGTVLELMSAIATLAPEEGMNFTRFSFTHNDSIDIVGRARELNFVDKLSEQLRDLGKSTIPQFAQARQLYTSMSRERDKEVINFAVSIPFPSDDTEGEGDD